MLSKGKQEKIDVGETAESFKAIILQKQSEYKNNGTDYTAFDLIKGTPYEKGVAIKDNKIFYKTPFNEFRWIYVDRCGNVPAILTSVKKF